MENGDCPANTTSYTLDTGKKQEIEFDDAEDFEDSNLADNVEELTEEFETIEE